MAVTPRTAVVYAGENLDLAAGAGNIGGRGNTAGTAPGLTTLPPVSLREGRVFIGPFRLPLQPLPPLY